MWRRRAGAGGAGWRLTIPPLTARRSLTPPAALPKVVILVRAVELSFMILNCPVGCPTASVTSRPPALVFADSLTVRTPHDGHQLTRHTQQQYLFPQFTVSSGISNPLFIPRKY